MTRLRPKPGILDISPYVGGESRVPGVNRIIKLASNEGAFGPSPAAAAAMRDALPTAHRYPDGAATRLRQALARAHGLDAARIVCGAGSDELITLACRAYAGPGDEVLYTHHGFLMYPIAARGVGATPVIAEETARTANVNALLAAMTPATRIVFLANPNNPTGTYLPKAELRRLRRGLRPDILLLIDAAYAEYVEAEDYDDGFELVEEGDNVVITRTFSKIYGLGGVRLGWGYCPATVADVFNRLRNPFNVASLAQVAGIAALADPVFVAQARAHNSRWRQWTADELRALGLGVGDSHGNFVLVEFPETPGRDAASADAHLKARGLIVRRMASYHLPNCLRITIGREEEMRELVATLAEFVRSGS